ncbi:MAG: 3'(2'),5'-bisphosphate nucleotidase CysQ [Pseudomonadota bacterium]
MGAPVSFSADDLRAFASALIPTAREAGAAIMEAHARGVQATAKLDGSPVTEADLAADRIITRDLAKVSREIPIVTEENSSNHDTSRGDTPFWLIDPLDGTKEFLKPDGRGAFTVNIALIMDRSPIFGIVYAPALDRLFWGGQGVGAVELAGDGSARSLHVRGVPATGPVAVASSSHRDARTDRWLAAHGITHTTSIGSSLKFCLVAAGEADLYPRFGPTMEWDTAAGDAVLRAAGGAVTDEDGAPYRYAKPGHRNGPFIALGGFTPT